MKEKINKKSALILVIMLLPLPLQLLAADVKPLLKADKSWNGGNFAYPAGQPEIISAHITLKLGETIPYHCHVVPTFGYIIKGKIKVSLLSGESKVFHQGESLLEVFKTLHRGVAVDGPVELVVFYAGAKGLKNTYEKGDERCQKGIYN